MWDPATDAWLSGFADGEASFLIVFSARPDNPRGKNPALAPRLTVGLRADDTPVLRALQERFGGRLNFDLDRENARCRWIVTRKVELAALVEYFDRFPLRAKKAADYAIWREAVALYVARGGVSAYEELDVLRIALGEAREYVAPVPLRAVA